MCHPASTTHSNMGAEARAEMGVTEGMLRLNVGLEDPDDLIEDLDQALRKVGLVTDARAPAKGPRRLPPRGGPGMANLDAQLLSRFDRRCIVGKTLDGTVISLERRRAAHLRLPGRRDDRRSRSAR